MKLFTALGPGDIVGAHRTQMSGRSVLSETSYIYSGQLFEYCRERGIETLAISHHSRRDSVRDEPLQIENQPRIFEKSRGVRYHFSRVVYALYLAIRAWRFGADLAIINAGTAHYFALTSFRLLGIPVAVNFHGTLWPNGYEPKRRVARLIQVLDAWFFRRAVVATAGVSPECGRQVRQLANVELPFFEYRAQFRINEFSSRQKDKDAPPFRVTFVGRAEQNKGILDIVVMAERIRNLPGSPSIVFEICGDGEALSELKRIIQEKNLDERVFVHGQLPRPELLKVYARTHAVVVPTRSDFAEGLPKVCAEAVLSGLPIVTSRLSNALPVLGPAIQEAESENVDSYVEAIVALAKNRAIYEQRQSACAALARQFIDRSKSYPAAMDRLIAHVFPRWQLLNDYTSLFARID